MSLLPDTVVERHGLRLEIAAVSEQGPRTENQDAYAVDAFEPVGLVAVADGMGGEKGGRLAADIALRALLDGGPIRSMDDARRAVRAADESVVRAAGENPGEHGGMGCALGLLALASDRGDAPAWIGAHVGDVRILSRSPDGAIRLETRDHTPAFARWEAGEISLDEIPDTAGANRLQRAVGRGGEADVTWLPARAGWSWLIISDGVYKAMRLDELGEVMAAPTAAQACEAIRAKVEERGPDDNYTAVLVRALGGGGRAVAPASPERTDPMPMPASNPSPARSGWAAAALVLAMLALGAAGFALWSTWQLRDRSALEDRSMRTLQERVDSLDARVEALAEPFGPAVPAALPDTSAPAARPIPR